MANLLDELPCYEFTHLGAYLLAPSQSSKAAALNELMQLAEDATGDAIEEARWRAKTYGEIDQAEAMKQAAANQTSIQASMAPLLTEKYEFLRYQILDQDKLALLMQLCELLSQQASPVYKAMALELAKLIPKDVGATYFAENCSGYVERMAYSFYHQQSKAINAFSDWATKKVMDADSAMQAANLADVSRLVSGMNQRLDTFIAEKKYNTLQGRMTYQEEVGRDVRESRICVEVL